MQTTLLEYGRYSPPLPSPLISPYCIPFASQFADLLMVDVMCARRKGVLVSGGSSSSSSSSNAPAQPSAGKPRAGSSSGALASALAVQQLEEEAEAALDPVRFVDPMDSLVIAGHQLIKPTLPACFIGETRTTHARDAVDHCMQAIMFFLLRMMHLRRLCASRHFNPLHTVYSYLHRSK